METWYWLIVLAVFLIIEIISLGLTTIWFAAGAMVAYLIGLAGVNLLGQIACFFVVSFLLLFFTRPVALRYFNRDRQKTNLDGLVGMYGRVTMTIDNQKQQGKVVLDGKEWTARTEDDRVIEEGARVKALAISGVKLIVTDEI